MNPSVDRIYEEAKLGMWDGVLKRLKADDRLAARAAVYARPASGWTLLHQAAFWGNDEACRFLLNAGASPAAVCHAGMRPDQAARRRKHDDLAAWLRDLAEEASQTQHAHEHRHALRMAAATTGFGVIVRTACNDAMVRLRRPSKSSTRVPATTTTTDTSEAAGGMPSAITPCSRRCNEAIEMRAATHLEVAYGGGVVLIPQGARYHADRSGDVVVGWHGTYDPPSDMDGVPLV